jgi:tetratricopeptide (TPR) repeat protein
MADDTQVSIQDLRQRLAQAGTDAGRLAALLEFRDRTAELPRGEAEAYFREAVELARKTESYDDLARAGIALSELCRNAGDVAASLECAGYVQQAATATGSRKHEGSHLYLLGRAHQDRGDYTQARECYERCLKVWRLDRHTKGVGAALNQLGSLLGLQGQAAEALEYYQECLKIDDELGDVVYGTLHQYNIGEALARLGRWEDAVESYYRAIALSERHRMPSLRETALNALGELFLERDKVAKAIDTFRAVAEAGETEQVLPTTRRDAMGNLGLAYHRLGDLAGAGRAYERALEASEQSGDRRMATVLWWRMAELALDQGELARAREMVDRSFALAREVGLRGEEAHAFRVEGLLHAAGGESEQAHECFEQALVLLQDLEDSYDLARVRFHYGRCLLAEGETELAVSQLKAASRVFRKLGIVGEAQEVHRLLFQQEMGADRDMAMLQGISGLATLGVDPQVLLERAVGLLLEALKFDRAAILVRGRPVLMAGNPNLNPVLVLGASQQVIVTGSMLSWPVRYGGSLLGRIYLERAEPLTIEHNHLVLDTIANLLAAPIHRLAELSVSVVEERPGMAGLRYKGVVSRNPRMAEVLATVCAVAGKGVPVLIRGESGTGKELIARALHESGARAGKPFVAVNCAAVPENLLEAEFFGVEKGAATGVVAHRGKFETADGGTVFLDEIGDMSPALQAKLLRVLQEKTFERVGGRVSIGVDVRVVAATNQAIGELIAQRKFREDLYYRLNTVELLLPSLRERSEDIPDLVRHFVRHSNQEFGRDVADVSPDVMSRLKMHNWPGNIRELEHVVERSVLLARGDTIQLDDLPPSLVEGGGMKEER